MEIVYKKIKIYGKVQGVFFRKSAKEKADELGVFGFAKNENDGSVFIEIEGEINKIKEFIEWCNIGSSDAIVEKVEIKNGDLKNFKDFLIIT